MKTVLWVLLGLVVLGGVVFFLGPRIQVDTKLEPVNLPKDLEAYLKQSEAKVKNLRPNTEKKIVWADPKTKAQTHVALVFIHGFGATRQEVEPLCPLVAKALNANLFYTRLHGHGQTGVEMGVAKASEWLQDTKEAYEIGRRIGKKVIFVASSTGATLSLWFAATQDVSDLFGMALLSPNIHPKNSSARVFLQPWGLQLAKMIAGKRYTWKPTNKEQAKYWTYDHPIEGVYQMMGLVQELEKADLSKIKVPTMFIYSNKDQVISQKALKKAFAKVGASKKKMMDVGDTPNKWDHVLAGDIVNATMTKPVSEKIIAFFKPLVETPIPDKKAETVKANKEDKPKER
ncbi:MAG: hypothetical protein EP343_01825 [Deltaproteobacteria bacterium]|nr:MAG: hypothetical protein EP343_01825 [Deltaproteobacteria bacterium]